MQFSSKKNKNGLTIESNDSEIDKFPEKLLSKLTRATTKKKHRGSLSVKQKNKAITKNYQETLSVKEKDFIVIKFMTEKNRRKTFYAGEVCNILENNKLEVMLLRKRWKEKYIFCISKRT